MKLFSTSCVSLSLLALAATGYSAAPRQSPEKPALSAQAASPAPGGRLPNSIQIIRRDTVAQVKGEASIFVGSVLITPLYKAAGPRRAEGASVTFAPGARSAWHSHPAGQTLIVTSGNGWVQEWGGEKKPFKAGDVIWTPPGVKHWHGATATDSMTHVAIQEQVDGKVVNWMELVTDKQYGSCCPLSP